MWHWLFAVMQVVIVNGYSDGTCPEPTAAQNFNASAWDDKLWYMIATYSDDPEFKGACPTYEDTLIGDTYTLQKWYIIDGVRYHLEGSAKARSTDGSGIFNASATWNNELHHFITILLASDYTSYAVAYNCVYYNTTDSHQIFSWIMSRTTVLEDSAKIPVMDVIKNTSVLDPSKFVKNDFSDEACSFNSTVDLAD